MNQGFKICSWTLSFPLDDGYVIPLFLLNPLQREDLTGISTGTILNQVKLKKMAL